MGGLRLDILCSDGSPLGVCETTINGDPFRVGVGGSELALLTMCALWQKAGHRVRLYNNPWQPNGSSFEQLPISSFSPSDSRDFLIVFRSPNGRAIPAKGKKIWWSCDQYTVGDFRSFSDCVDKIVCISPFHAEYFRTTYGINNTVVIDLPVRVDEFPGDVERVPNRLIFTSVPDRGLQNLWRIYPRIKAEIPDLTLAITSDYRLWGAGELNQQHRARWLVQEGIDFLGAISRQQYLQELSCSDLMVYPCEYDELFCISVAEAQVAGVPCITSAKGALTSTNMGHLFWVGPSNPANDVHFVNRAISVLSNRVELDENRKLIQQMAIQRFSPGRILEQWDKNIFEEK
jgi:glycosyltransferase involved in cell wall biosynthesis